MNKRLITKLISLVLVVTLSAVSIFCVKANMTIFEADGDVIHNIYGEYLPEEELTPKEIESYKKFAEVIVNKGELIYSGEEIEPSVTVLGEDGLELVKDIDYAISYTDNVNAGTANYEVTGMGLYNDVFEGNFIINPKDISKVRVKVNEQEYTGQAQEPVLYVYDDKMILVVGMDYTAVYSNNINAGQAEVTLTGIGNYTGSLKRSFKINAKPVTTEPETETIAEKEITVKRAAIRKAKNIKGRRARLKWKKISGVTGYKVKYALNKKMTKKAKTKTIKKNISIYTIKKLKKRRYYFRLRAYKKINKKTYYGSWSKIKKVKITK